MISYRAPMSAWSPIAAADPLAGSGLGTVAVTLAPLSLAATGTVANQVFHGTLGATLAPLTLAAAGSALVTGTLGATSGPLSLVGFGTVANPGVLTATLHATLDPLALAATGGVSASPAAGTLSATLDPLALSGRGFVATRVYRGTLSATLGALAASANGHVTTPPRTATLHATLGPVVLSGGGTVEAILPVWPHDWCPALGPTRSSTLVVDVVQYGDGYCHRATRGLDPVRPTADYQFPFAEIEQLYEMDAFLKNHGARGFLFQPPDAQASVMVSCDTWSATLVDRTGSGEVVGALRSTFVRQFNPQPLNVP